MFKSRLIENPRYYKLIRYQLLFYILVFIPFTVILGHLGISERWVALVSLLLEIALGGSIYIIFMRPLNQYLSRKILEIEKDHIRIVNSNGLGITAWDVSEVDSIVTSEDYYQPNGERISWLYKLRQPPHHNFREIKNGEQKSRYEFHLDSDYMRVQINKIVDSWIAKGVKVERK